MQIAVGGCLAQKDRDVIVRKAPWVDVVFGTHNIGSLPVLLERARHNEEAQVEILESLEVFPSTLPTRRESAYAAWVSISVGCNNTCTFCIVPSLRGKEKDRRPGDVLAEVEALVAEGAIEVTLLGQNVNTYGVEFGDRGAFGKLLRAVGAVDGLERVRFTSPHPAAFTDDVLAAMAETPNVMPQLHMPLQSGSDRVLKAMRRSYRRRALPRHRRPGPRRHPRRRAVHRHHRRLPGETEEDFQATLDVVERRPASRRRSRSSTPSAPGRPPRLPDQLPEGRRPGALRAAGRPAGADLLGGEPPQEGRVLEVLVAEGEGRKDGATARLSGRAPDNRLVHFALPKAWPRTRLPAPATSPRSRSPTGRRTTWSRTASSPADPSPSGARAPATRRNARSAKASGRRPPLGMPALRRA